MTHRKPIRSAMDPHYANLRDGGNMPPARPGLIRAWIADVFAVACLAAIFLAVPWILYAMGAWQ
jgi:hypothetical protein